MHQGFEDYLLHTHLMEHERTIAQLRREHEALGVRPARRRFSIGFGWASRVGRAVRIGGRAPVSEA